MKKIGIIGASPAACSEVYSQLVHVAAKNGAKDDQDHIPAIVVSLPYKDDKQMFQTAILCKRLGAEFIIISEQCAPSLRVQLAEFLSLTIVDLTGNSPADVALLAYNFAHHSTNIETTLGFISVSEHTINDQELKDFVKKIHSEVIGVIGGAGPFPTADYCKRIASKNCSYILLSDVEAPYKNKFLMGESEEDFRPFYLKDYALLDKFVTMHTMPCNTAHAYITEFSGIITKPIIDIRYAVAEYLKSKHPSQKNVILAGTSATVAKIKIYQSILTKEGFTIIEPDEAEQEAIMQVIYDIKAAKNSEKIKEDSTHIYQRIKERNNTPNALVLLLCTELNLPFTDADLMELGFISSTHALADIASHKSLSWILDNFSLQTKTEDNTLTIYFGRIAKHDPKSHLILARSAIKQICKFFTVEAKESEEQMTIISPNEELKNWLDLNGIKIINNIKSITR